MNERPEESLIEDTSGVAFAEYTILLGLVTVIGAVAVFSVGLPLYQTFRFAQLLVALPIP
jgi:Flp pilus assembly pilin Flp